MNKEQFLNILSHYSGSTPTEAEEILLLRDRYPYSQVLQTLSARVSKDHNFHDSQSKLQSAAVYASDRSALKSIMDHSYHILENSENSEIGNLSKKLVEGADIVVQDAKLDGVADEVIQDLARLSQLKNNFEMMFADNSVLSVRVELDSVTLDQTVEPTLEEGKSRKQRIVDLAKVVSSQNDSRDLEAKRLKERKKKKDAGEDIIEQIVTKVEIVPESEKHKEQIEIIDHFIKAQPSITSAKERQLSQAINDFNTIKTGEFGDNVISETLVQILLKQGKKDKAIEVLKKLIWKFPQKMAYFASQIEELKK